MNQPSLFRRAQGCEAIKVRGVHLDLKGMPPTFPRLLELVRLFAELKFNLLLIEWEDAFPWVCDERLRSADSYTEEEITILSRECKRLGLEIVPLVQGVGHAENALSLEGYEAMREVPDRTDVYHPLHSGAPELVRRMVLDVLALLPDVRRFHLGGDEAYTLGQHPASAALVAAEGHEALYLRQLEPALQELEQREIRPLLWHDEMIHWSPEKLRALGKRVDLLVWGYSGDPRDPTTYHHRLPHAEKLREAGCRLWAATAHKGADGPCSSAPSPLRREIATRAWVEMNTAFGWVGVISSGWSRYSSGRSQVDPLEASLDSLVNTAVILHDGEPHENGLAACEAWLGVQEGGRHFLRLRELMTELADHAEKGWRRVRMLEEQRINLHLEPRRAGSGIEGMILDLLDADVNAMKQLEPEIETRFSGLVPAWCARFFPQVRRQPLEEAAARLRVLLER